MQKNNIQEGAALGIDIGGTTVNLGLVRRDGTAAVHTKRKSRPQPAKEWAGLLIREIDTLLADVAEQPVGIGIGVRASVDHRAGQVRKSSVVLQADEFDLCEALRRRYGLPVYIENDVKAATIAELLFGTGQTEQTFACVNVGTGLALGLVLEGILVHGDNNNAGEAGLLLVERPEADGIPAPLETLVCGRGLAAEAKRLQAAYPHSALFAGHVPFTGRRVAEACNQGDALAKHAVANMQHHLALLLLNLHSLLDIGVFVLVGSVMAAPWMREALQKEIERIASAIHYGIFKWDAEVRVSALGPSMAGLCGAGGLVFYREE